MNCNNFGRLNAIIRSDLNLPDILVYVDSRWSSSHFQMQMQMIQFHVGDISEKLHLTAHLCVSEPDCNIPGGF